MMGCIHIVRASTTFGMRTFLDGTKKSFLILRRERSERPEERRASILDTD